MEFDLTIVDESCLLDERRRLGDDTPEWLLDLGRSINRLHHSQAALHRKVDHMTKVGEDLTASIEALEEKEGLLETAVGAVATAITDSGVAFNELDAHIEELIDGGVLTPEQGEALTNRANAVGGKIETAAQALTSAAASLTTQASTAEQAGGVGDGAGTGGDKAGGGTPEVKVDYNFTGDPGNIDLTAWTKNSTEQGTGGVALYTFNADVPGGPPTGPVVVGGVEGWTVYTGEKEAIPAA